MQLTPGQVDDLIRAAIAAPSADNRCVFRWTASNDRITLLAREDRTDQPLHRQLLTLMSVGAAAVNVELQARSLGFVAECAIEAPPKRKTFLAEFQLGRATIDSRSTQDDALAGEIFRRHSNRAMFFEGPGLTPREKQLMNLDAAEDGTSLMHWFDAPELRRKAIGLLVAAETQRFNREYLHRELFESIRFDLSSTESTDTGLPPGSLGLPKAERLGFSMFRSWRIQRLMNLLGAHHIMAFRAANLPNRFAAHVCSISSNATDPFVGAYQTGRALQRVWLRASALGCAFQVFAASPLYALAGAPGMPRDIQDDLIEGWARLCAGSSPYIAFRMGHAAPPKVRTNRPPPSAIFINP